MKNTPKGNIKSNSIINQIQNELKTRIIEGDIKPDEKLPSEPALASELGVSRNSLREAIGLLEKEGLLIRRRGIGTFVTNRNQIKGGIEKLTGIKEFVEAQGLEFKSKILRFEYKDCEKIISEKLDLKINEKVLILETVKFASEIPVAVCLDIIPRKFVDEVEPKKIHCSLFEGLRKYHDIDIRSAECELVPMVSDKELSAKLDLRINTPLLMLEQIHYDSQNKKIFYSKSYFPEKKFTFKLIRRR